MKQFYGPAPLPPLKYGTYCGLCVYPMRGENFVRKASSLTAERVKTAPEFKPTMAWADRLKAASRLGSAVYAMLPAYRKKHKLYQQHQFHYVSPSVCIPAAGAWPAVRFGTACAFCGRRAASRIRRNRVAKRLQAVGPGHRGFEFRRRLHPFGRQRAGLAHEIFSPHRIDAEAAIGSVL